MRTVDRIKKIVRITRRELTSALPKQEKGNGKIKAIHFCKLLIKEMLAFMDLGMLMLPSYLKLEVTIKAAQARIGHKDIQNNYECLYSCF